MPPASRATAPRTDPRVVRTQEDVLRATLQVLLDEGWDAVTHQRIAQVAGYSKATLYNHWPTRQVLVSAAFGRLRVLRHPVATGDLRQDLINELVAFRNAIRDDRLDQGLSVLVQLIQSMPELATVRKKLVTEGELVVRRLLRPYLRSAPALDAAVFMLSGAVLSGAMMHGRAPSDRVIGETVDLVLTGLDIRST